jgi:hypothetical protein
MGAPRVISPSVRFDRVRREQSPSRVLSDYTTGNRVRRPLGGMNNPIRYFKTSPEIIRMAVMMFIRFPLSLRNVEDVLHERRIDNTHERTAVAASVQEKLRTRR